eukprot:6161414-Prorocentrum_lima.AAC.1
MASVGVGPGCVRRCQGEARCVTSEAGPGCVKRFELRADTLFTSGQSCVICRYELRPLHETGTFAVRAASS